MIPPKLSERFATLFAADEFLSLTSILVCYCTFLSTRWHRKAVSVSGSLAKQMIPRSRPTVRAPLALVEEFAAGFSHRPPPTMPPTLMSSP